MLGRRTLTGALAGGIALAAPRIAGAQALSLTLASMNDPFAPQLARLAPRFRAETGIELKVDILSYPELLSRVTADFVGRTRSYDLTTMDIVWAGQFAEAGYTVRLNDWMERDKAELGLEDIYPAALRYLGHYRGAQVAFPFAAYCNVLAYRRDVYEAAGATPPETMDGLVATAARTTNAAGNIWGWAANGRRGPAAAQDWMQYNTQIGGAILGPDGRPALASDANTRSLTIYRDLFRASAPPGAVNYDWAARHEAYRQGLVAAHQVWTISLPSYDNPEVSRVVGRTGIALAPTGEGMAKLYGLGGWALSINAAIDPAKQQAGWRFIKWVTSAAIQREFLLNNVGVFIRRSTVRDAELRMRFPFLAVVDQSLENGDGDFRPRIPQYPQLQDLLGTAVNAAVVGNADPRRALEEAQARALRLF